MSDILYAAMRAARFTPRTIPPLHSPSIPPVLPPRKPQPRPLVLSPEAREALYGPPPEPKPPAPEWPEIPICPSRDQIIEAAIDGAEVTKLDILSHRRTANVILPRQIAMYLARTLTLWSLPTIGRLFGGRDHTTILYACRKVERRIAADPVFAARVAAIKSKLEAAQ